MAKKSSSRKTSTKRGSQKRQRVNTGTDTRYVKRTSSGRFKESDDAGRAQKVDRPRRAKKTVKSGYGDRGDRQKKADLEFARLMFKASIRTYPVFGLVAEPGQTLRSKGRTRCRGTIGNTAAHSYCRREGAPLW